MSKYSIPKIRLGRHGEYGIKTRFHPTAFGYGHTVTKAENFSADANLRRLKGLFKTWEIMARKKLGEPVPMPQKEKRRKRARLRETVAKEAHEIQEMARMSATAAMQRLTSIIEDEDAPDSAAIAASQVIFDRAYGKASQTNFNATVDLNGKPSEIGTKELGITS